MGCAISKLDSDVNLQCKERKKLIKNAVRYREDFSVAHIAYIQTLKDVGRALRRFSEGRDDNDDDDEEEEEEEKEKEKHEALMNISTHSSPNHHQVLHLTEGQEGSSTMLTLKDENLKEETLTEETVKEETESGLALPSSPKEAPKTMEMAPGLSAPPDMSEGPLAPDLTLGSSANGIASPDTARISSANGMGSPDMAGYTFSSPYRGYGFSSGPPSDRGNEFSPPFYSPRRDDSDEYYMDFSPSSHLANQTPPPMPSPIRTETSWFLFDIFDPPPIPYNLLEHRRRRSEIDDSLDYFKEEEEEEEVEDVNTKDVDIKNASVKDVGVMNVDVKDVDQMRKEEGIPDLEEDEIDDEEEENSLAKNSGNLVVEKESSNVEDKKVKLDDKKSTDDLVMTEKGNVNVEEITMVTPKHEDAVEARESPKELVAIADINARDLSEAVRHIHRHFSRAHRSGQDVSTMLETQLAAHHLNGLDLKEHSKVFNAITMHWSRQATVALKDTYKDRDVAECGMFGSHAATLERLCAWEGKLYEEVKAGERTRMAFDRKRNQLYNLEAKGGDRGVIDKTRSTLTKLENRLEVALKAIELASLRIQRLTNEELYPQLAELVGGLTIMWRVMWECHKAQKAIASEMQTIENSVVSDEASEAHIRATVDLQRELEKWKTHFQQWIEAQFNYIETLYLWLVKCLDPLDEGGDKSGLSISPNDSDSPDVIHFLASWLNALKELKTREQIAYAIDDFTGVVRSLEIEQEGELFIKKNTNKHSQVPKRVEKKYLTYGNDEALKNDADTQKSELENGLRRHSEVMQDRKERTLLSFKQHLPSIFDAMASFAKDASKFYEKVHPNSREKDRS